eukprot:1329793-Rhodomonas_salina.3
MCGAWKNAKTAAFALAPTRILVLKGASNAYPDSETTRRQRLRSPPTATLSPSRLAIRYY